jgi:hypothetical protein
LGVQWMEKEMVHQLMEMEWVRRMAHRHQFSCHYLCLVQCFDCAPMSATVTPRQLSVITKKKKKD